MEALRKQHKLPMAGTTHCLDYGGRTEMESHKSDPWDWVSGKQCVPTANQAFITQDVFQYVQSHSEKKLATLLSNQRDFFFGCSCLSFLFIVEKLEAQADPTPLLSVSSTLAILPSKHWLSHRHISPGHEARKVKPEILESLHQCINNLSSPQRTNPLSEKEVLILWQTWRKKNSHLFWSFVTYRLTFGLSRKMQYTGGSSCTCKTSFHHLQKKKDAKQSFIFRFRSNN